jgi:YD repeat-containing protein
LIEYNRCACPVGEYLSEETKRCELDKWLPDQSCTVGHPVSPATGAKVKEQVDYTGAGAAPLSFVRSYNSDPRMGWTHNWAKRLDLFGHPFVIWAYRGSSSRVAFTDPDLAGTAYAYQPVLPNRDVLSNTLDANGNISGWTLRIFEDDSREHYDAYGRLLSVEMRNGWRYTLTYKSGRLDKVTNPFGRTLGFRYNAEGRMSRLIDPAGGEIAYGYDSRGNPNRVTWQDKKFRRYHYEDKRFPELLTGITDEADVRVETYSYDDQRRVKETSLAGGVDRLTFEYGGISGSPQTVVTQYTEAGSTASTYGFTRPAGGLAWAPTSITAPCSLCGNTQANTTYDSAGRVFKAVAHDDTPTFYQYDDANGRETERATFPASFQLAFTRPALEEATRVISTRWHATWNLPREEAEPNKITEYGYDGNGNLKSESWSATKDDTGAKAFDAVKTGSTYATEWLLNEQNLNTRIIDKTDGRENARWKLSHNKFGDLTQVDSLTIGTTAKAIEYDAAGNAKKMISESGTSMDLTYDGRGRLKTFATSAGNSVIYTYKPWGALEEAVASDGGRLTYRFDDNHRLQSIVENGEQLYPPPAADAIASLERSRPEQAQADPLPVQPVPSPDNTPRFGPPANDPVFGPRVAPEVFETLGRCVARFGALALAISPSELSACQGWPRPISCNGTCGDLLFDMYKTMQELSQRFAEMYWDRCDQFNLAFDKPNPSLGPGCNRTSWKGHEKQIRQFQKRLEDLIIIADKLGCNKPPEAWYWRSKPVPIRPAEK